MRPSGRPSPSQPCHPPPRHGGNEINPLLGAQLVRAVAFELCRTHSLPPTPMRHVECGALELDALTLTMGVEQSHYVAARIVWASPGGKSMVMTKQLLTNKL